VGRILLIFLFLLAIGIDAQSMKELRLAIQKMAADEDLKNASIGFYALDLDSNKVIARLEANKSLVPASAMKLVSTATALELLGPGKRFSTTIKYSGEIDTNCVLNGNIYIQGGGDPCLGSERFSKHYGDFINKWTQEIIKLGIDSINGRVIGDATIFDDQMIPSTWIWADLGNYYGAGACGLSIYENKCRLALKSGKRGDSTEIACVYPYIPNLSFSNDVKGMVTHKDQSYIFGGPYQENRSIEGGIPVHSNNFMVKGSIPDPSYLTAFELDMNLRNQGIKLANPSTTIRKIKQEGGHIEKVKKRKITTKHSPKLIDIIELTNFNSINLYAEHLINHIGVYKYRSGDTGSGAQATTLFWKENDLDISGMYIYDGSGLSRFNSITAKQLVGVLKHMNQSKNSKLFINALPMAGKSGTMRNMGKGTAASGRVRAKSGTMTRIKSYAGYVTTKNKKHIAFALIVNNFNCSSFKMKKKIEKIMIKLAEIER